MDARRSLSVLFNKNASPFFPAQYPPPPPGFPYAATPGFAADPPPVTPPVAAPIAAPAAVKIANLPPGTAPLLLHEYVAAEAAETAAETGNFSVHPADTTSAIVEFALADAAAAAVQLLHGRQWHGHTLAATPHGPENFYYIPPYQYPIDYGYVPPMFAPYGYYGVLPMPTRTASRRLSAKSVSRHSPVGTYKPTPPFVLSMMNDEDDGHVTIEDEEGHAIRVNPKRLFVGNIPYNSTWPVLKNFLVTRAAELEPNNTIDILRVEIPMQQPRDGPDVAKLNSYLFLTRLGQPEEPRPPRGMSRGFAIVTTANQESLEKLIRYFDNVEFEGRLLTVRYDRFPDFNNYVLQQLFTPGKQHNKLAFLTNLAFERNLFHHKYYYAHQSPRPPAPDDRFGVAALAQLLDEIELERSEAEKARELVDAFSARDMSA